MKTEADFSSISIHYFSSGERRRGKLKNRHNAPFLQCSAFHFDSFSSGNWRKLQTRIKTMQERAVTWKNFNYYIFTCTTTCIASFPSRWLFLLPLMKISTRLDICCTEEMQGCAAEESRIDKSHPVMCFVNKLHTTGRKRWFFMHIIMHPKMCWNLKVSRICRLKSLMHARNTFCRRRSRQSLSSFRFERQSWVEKEIFGCISKMLTHHRPLKMVLGRKKNLFRTRLARFDMHRNEVDPPNATHTKIQNKKFACLCSARWMTVQLLHF